MAPARCIERRFTNQAVDTGFGSQMTIGILAGDLDWCRFGAADRAEVDSDDYCTGSDFRWCNRDVSGIAGRSGASAGELNGKLSADNFSFSMMPVLVLKSGSCPPPTCGEAGEAKLIRVGGAGSTSVDQSIEERRSPHPKLLRSFDLPTSGRWTNHQYLFRRKSSSKGETRQMVNPGALA